MNYCNMYILRDCNESKVVYGGVISYNKDLTLEEIQNAIIEEKAKVLEKIEDWEISDVTKEVEKRLNVKFFQADDDLYI